MAFGNAWGDVLFYEGLGVSSEVPQLYSFALSGHPYLPDDVQQGEYRWRHTTIPLLKQQQQSDGKLGQKSINPNGLWRSSVETWHKGAGQLNYDLDDSDPARFYQSKGFDPWTRWNGSMLPDTTALVASANTNLRLAATTTRLFWTDGTAVKYSDDLAAVASMTGSPGSAWVGIASTGDYVYASNATDIYRWAATDTAVTAGGSPWSTGNVGGLWWVRGKARLMAIGTGGTSTEVYNITSSTLPSSIAPAIIPTGFTWVGFCDGPGVIYGAGYSGDKSLIFRWGIKSDGTGLDVAIPALVDGLPDGELVYSIASYLGFVLIGTDQGVRLAIPNQTTGNLTVGALIDIDHPVRCFEGQGSSVWFGWTNYDTDSTGLGRLSLTTFTDPDNQVPAYASDLMSASDATVQGNVLSVGTFLGKRVFAVSGAGVYAEDTDLVPEAWVESGWRSFGIPDDKVAMLIDVRHEPLVGTVAASLALDGSSTFAGVLTNSTAGMTGATVPAGELTAERFNSKLTLTRDAVTTTGPTVSREVLSMNPTADTGFLIIFPALLNEKDVIGQTSKFRDPDAELRYLQNLRASRDVVAWQEGSRTYSVSLEDFVWLPRFSGLLPDKSAFPGTCVLQLKVAV